MARVENYRKLVAWQKAMDLVEGIYQTTDGWPRGERNPLTDQVRRAAVSVPSNIAEGQGRTGPREFLHHLSIAKGSLHEMETQLLIAQRLGYSAEVSYEALLGQADEVGRLLLGLIRSLRPPASER